MSISSSPADSNAPSTGYPAASEDDPSPSDYEYWEHDFLLQQNIFFLKYVRLRVKAGTTGPRVKQLRGKEGLDMRMTPDRNGNYHDRVAMRWGKLGFRMTVVNQPGICR